MWLLSTDRAELHFFVSPNRVNGGYAILSHVWGDNEQSFQDVQAIRKSAEEDGRNPRDLVSAKIRECCLLAERHGYKWVWNDTCCIDKSSSAELSEAINSMFLWYSQADICYAYLQDVPSDAPDLDTKFRASRWYTRGWTLQELIAPDLLIFVSADWEMIGGRAELASSVTEITKIPEHVLRKEISLGRISVAQRMSWAARRETTRMEDRAYSLLGIFGISLPILYGEGPQAFQRLQEEIMRTSIDPSLFAWGPQSPDTPKLDGYSNLARPTAWLMAGSPSDFENCAAILALPTRRDHSITAA
ncbi:HET-domain-containing protein [Coniophora puteana RWD-64-598 SS2]|uniref:HET-domain-containing protein n=1 Tax=Coniophora puteana (strain RWD-64-598) TaxID=741705 RepID=A0A5M3MIE8_CONPW|nr:HET-domain-containing protein [Coniophora puteana RWD-64-598 SS2]EIW78776.1 HET-domain-containing protein [Coniophora puteana RWD-64-598 SS2]